MHNFADLFSHQRARIGSPLNFAQCALGISIQHLTYLTREQQVVCFYNFAVEAKLSSENCHFKVIYYSASSTDRTHCKDKATHIFKTSLTDPIKHDNGTHIACSPVTVSVKNNAFVQRVKHGVVRCT